MARGLGTLVVDLLLKTGSFESDMGRASKTAQKRMKEIERSAKAAGAVLGTALVAGAGLAAVAIKSAIDSADQLNEISKKVGIPTDVLSGLQYAAKLSGVATEELQNGLVKLAKFQLDAAQGGKDSTRIFEAFGIAVKDASGNLWASDQVFNDFADVFKALPDGPEKTALALKVFGKAGAELIPLLDEGRAGLSKYSDELKQLGGVVTPATAAAADAFNDNLDKLKVAFSGAALTAAKELLPSLIEVTDELVDFLRDGTAAGGAARDLGETFAQLARDTRNVFEEVAGLRKLYGEQGLFADDFFSGDGLFKTLGEVDKAFKEREERLARLRELGLNGDLGAKRGFVGLGTLKDQAKSRSAARGLNTEDSTSGSKARKTEADSLTEAYQRMNAQMAETIALFGQTTEVAKVRYDLENGELSKLSKAQKDNLLQQAAQIDVLKERADAEKDAARAIEETNQANERNRKAAADLLADIEFETSLLKLNNDERERAIVLRGLNGVATEEEAAKISAALEALQKDRKLNDELVANMDEFRSAFADNVTDVLTGAKSIGDAFKSLADQVIAQIARILAQKLTESLLGVPGSTGAGTSGGGFLGSLFSSFLGGGGGIPGFATGTDFAPGGLAMVGERGPELVSLPRGAKVFPNGSMPGGVTVTNNINVSGSTSRETAEQIAHKVAMATSRAVARTA